MHIKAIDMMAATAMCCPATHCRLGWVERQAQHSLELLILLMLVLRLPVLLLLRVGRLLEPLASASSGARGGAAATSPPCHAARSEPEEGQVNPWP